MMKEKKEGVLQGEQTRVTEREISLPEAIDYCRAVRSKGHTDAEDRRALRWVWVLERKRMSFIRTGWTLRYGTIRGS